MCITNTHEKHSHIRICALVLPFFAPLTFINTTACCYVNVETLCIDEEAREKERERAKTRSRKKPNIQKTEDTWLVQV